MPCAEKWSLRRQKRPKRKAKTVFFFGGPPMPGNARKKEKVGGVSGGKGERAECARKGEGKATVRRQKCCLNFKWVCTSVSVLVEC